MIHHLALLALPACTVAAQEISVQEPVQRELRIYPVEPLIRSRVELVYTAPDGGYLNPVNPEIYTLNPEIYTLRYADFIVGSDLYPRVPLGLEFRGGGRTVTMAGPHSGFDSVQEVETIAARFCEPALDPKQERIQADAQGYLLAYLRPEQHDWLQRFLDLQSDDSRHWLADVGARIYSVPKGALAKMNLDGSATLLDAAAAIERVAAALVARGAKQVSAPRLSLLPGRRGDVSVLNSVSYVKAFELHVVEPGNVEILDPVVDVIQEGYILKVLAMQVSDEHYGIEIESISSEIERPILTKKVKPSPLYPAEVEIGLPQVRTASVSATVRLADGAGVLLVASGLAEDRDLAVILTFRRAVVEPTEEE